MSPAKAAENYGDKSGLTWYLRWGIYTSIQTWVPSQNSLIVPEAMNLKICSHGTSFKWSHFHARHGTKTSPVFCWWRSLLVTTSKFGLLTIRQHSATRKHLFLHPQGERSGLIVHLPKLVSTDLTRKSDLVLTNLVGKVGVRGWST